MRHILLVDDNEAYTDSIKDILEDEGYTVKTANNGESACDIMQKNHFDMVLMDIKMPGMNGVETFLKMKQFDSKVRVVLFTAYALTELIEEAHANGVLAVLKKPLDMNHLDRILKKQRDKASGGYILIADDDGSLCDNLAEILTENGYKVVVASDGLQAVNKAKNRNFDVFLLDLKMPQLNGLEAYREIREQQPEPVTILMTGYAEEMKDLVTKALDENVYTMLPKPIDVRQLLYLLDQAAEGTKS